MNENEYETLKIVNIVASGSIADNIDLEMISNNLDGCELNTKRFPGAVYRMQDPKFAVLIFSSGKVVFTGFQTVEDIPVGIHKFLAVLKMAGVPCTDEPQIGITNLVCSYSLGIPCNLNKVVITFNYENIEYEPEQFPGLVYRIADPKIVILVFSSGNIILTGAKDMNEIKKGLCVFKEKMSSVM